MAATNPTDQLAPVEIHSDKKEPVGDVEADLKAGSVADLDDAELFLQQNGISHVRLAEMMQDEARLKKLRRKVDWTLMPLLCGTYLLQNIDKSAISYGAVFDLLSSTGTTGNQYSWLASLFYFAYLISEWPASYLVQRFRTGKIVAVFVIIWGCVLLCTAACRNFAGLAVCRFMLGIFEAVITPAFMLIVSQWFARDKQPARAGLFYCFNGVGLTVAGLLFFAVGQAKGMETWRIIFLLCGAATALWGVLLFFFLSDNILSATQFTIEERALLIAQNARGRSGVYNHNIKPYQIKEVFYDSQVWLLFFFVMLNEVMNGGLANFSGLIVEGFTHNALLTTVYGVPFGACTTIFMFTGPYMASKVKNVRTIVMALWVLPTLVAVSLFWKLPRSDKGGLLAGYYICAAYVGSLIVALQMPASNVAGYTKRTTATAFVFLGYCIGNIIGPHAFIASQAPIYTTGCEVIAACVVGQVVIAILLRHILSRRNRLREALGHSEETDLDQVQDLTDFENPKFRYAY